MLVKYFHTHSIPTYISVFVLSLCFWLSSYFTNLNTLSIEQDTWILLLNTWLKPGFINSFISFIIILSTGIFINLITQKEEVVYDKLNQLPGVLYVLGCFIVSHFTTLHTIPLINLTFIFALNLLWSSYRQESRFAKTYNLSFLFGISLVFYLSFALFFICLLFCLFTIKPVKTKEILLSCFGFVSPLYLKLTILFIFSKNKELSSIIHFKTETIHTYSALKISDLGIHALIHISLLLLLGLILIISFRNNIKVKTLKSRYTLFALICFCFIYNLIIMPSLSHLYGLLLLPCSILAADLISSIKHLKWAAFILSIIFINGFLYLLHQFGFLIYN